MTVKYAVATEFKAIDSMSRVFAQMEKSSSAFGRHARRDIDAAKSSLQSFKGVFTGIMASRVVTGLTSLIKQQFRSIFDEFTTFENALVSSASRMNIAKTSAEYKKLEKGIRSIGSTTEFTNTQVAQATEVLAQAGFRDVNIVESAVRSTTDLATIAKTELPEAMNISTKALDAFGMRTDKVDENVQNLIRINNAFSRASDASTISIEDMYETMKYAGSVASSSGSDIETFAALTGLVGRAAVEGTRAGTALAQVYTRLYNPVGKAARILKKFNIEIVDPKTGNFLDRMRILANFADAFKDLGQQKFGAAVKEIFDQRALKAIIPLLKLGSNEILSYREKWIETGKTAATKATEMRKSIENQFKLIESARIEKGFQFIDKIRDDLPDALNKVIKLVQSIDVNKVEKSFKAMYDTGKSIYNYLKKWKTEIKALGVVFLLSKVIAISEAFIKIVKAARLLTFAMGPFYLMVASIANLTFTIQENAVELGESFRYLWEDVIVKTVGKAIKKITGMIKGSFVESLLIKAGVLETDSLSKLEDKIDEIFGTKVYNVNLRPKWTEPIIVPDIEVPFTPVSEEQGGLAASKGVFKLKQRQSVWNPPEVKPSAIKPPIPAMQSSEAYTGSWQGTLNIEGAPPGSKMTNIQSTGMPSLDVNLGPN